MKLENSIINRDSISTLSQIAPNHTRLTLNPTIGQGVIDIYDIFKGITISIIQIASENWPIHQVPDNNQVIYINYCIKGRCELLLENSEFTYLKDNELCISKIPAMQDCYFPTKYYTGIEWHIDVNMLQIENPKFAEDFGWNVLDIIDIYAKANSFYSSIMNNELVQLFNEFWNTKEQMSIFKMRILTLELFQQLFQRALPTTGARRTYLTPSQLHIAKHTHKLLTHDLHVHHSVDDIAKSFGISQTSLRNYFKLLYGQNIAKFLREVRLCYAAEQLENSNDRITVISLSIGYENPSKFAAAFKSKFKMSPSEYRRIKQLNK